MLRSNSGSDEEYMLQTPTRVELDEEEEETGEDLMFPSDEMYEDVRMSPEDEHISKLEEGTVVWVKQTGFPRWPAMIKKDQEDCDFLRTPKRSNIRNMYQYHVIYFNEGKRSWLHQTRLRPFKSNKNVKPAEDVLAHAASTLDLWDTEFSCLPGRPHIDCGCFDGRRRPRRPQDGHTSGSSAIIHPNPHRAIQ